jgi:OpgC protein
MRGIHAAHILLFTIMVAEVSYVAISLDKPFYAEEVAITDFFKQPGIAMVQALLLRYRPLNMDVLPLYIVLMACLPLILLLIRWSANLTLAMSVALYAVSLRSRALERSRGVAHEVGSWRQEGRRWLRQAVERKEEAASIPPLACVVEPYDPRVLSILRCNL